MARIKKILLAAAMLSAAAVTLSSCSIDEYIKNIEPDSKNDTFIIERYMETEKEADTEPENEFQPYTPVKRDMTQLILPRDGESIVYDPEVTLYRIDEFDKEITAYAATRIGDEILFYTHETDYFFAFLALRIYSPGTNEEFAGGVRIKMSDGTFGYCINKNEGDFAAESMYRTGLDLTVSVPKIDPRKSYAFWYGDISGPLSIYTHDEKLIYSTFDSDMDMERADEYYPNSYEKYQAEMNSEEGKGE